MHSITSIYYTESDHVEADPTVWLAESSSNSIIRIHTTSSTYLEITSTRTYTHDRQTLVFRLCTTRVAPRSDLEADDDRLDSSADLYVRLGMLADSAIALESRADRGSRAKYEKGAHGTSPSYQVSLILQK